MAVMTAYAQVLAVDGDRVHLLVIELLPHGEGRTLPTSPGLALMLLLESTGEFANDSYIPDGLAVEAADGWADFNPYDGDHDLSEWFVANAPRVIKSLVAHEQRKVPVRSRLTTYRNGPQPEAIYEITVTDPAWVRHLRVGTEWESTAYRPEPDGE